MIVLSATTSNEPRRCPVLLQPFTLVAAFLFGFFGCIAYVQADDTQPNPAQTTDSPAISVLDGKTFAGELGLVGKPGLTADLFVFREGMFVSKECERRCGYTEGPYWVRFEGDGVQFKSEIPCLKSDATMVWNGTMKGDEIEGTIAWTSKRWYWTIEKEFWFKGKLVESNVAKTE
jgi:hypothetical protein